MIGYVRDLLCTADEQTVDFDSFMLGNASQGSRDEMPFQWQHQHQLKHPSLDLGVTGMADCSVSLQAS
jgi:hypothetical protein